LQRRPVDVASRVGMGADWLAVQGDDHIAELKTQRAHAEPATGKCVSRAPCRHRTGTERSSCREWRRGNRRNCAGQDQLGGLRLALTDVEKKSRL
jgi:hypothetical protein